MRRARSDSGREGFFELELSNIRTGVTRSALELPSSFARRRPAAVPAVFCDLACELTACITDLVIEQRIWCNRDIMRWAPRFPALRRLRLEVDDPRFRARPGGALDCPALKSVVIHSTSVFRAYHTIIAKRFLSSGFLFSLKRLSITVETST
ncbi:hypothetical protein AURDEDRAFT_113066 [Auricularia subglabra TFB-10046 SS5]|nr:hypothetical protein AURDEDRAFT_113066 [Auricularia subglabra TFB-10046 SS5]